MKIKVLVIALGMLLLSSCKKDYVCRIEWFDGPTEDVFEDLSKDEAQDIQESCEAIGGIWSIK